MTAMKKLQDAIASYTGNTGPVKWSVSEIDGGCGASLIATYGAKHAFEDEPWTQFGGDAILAAVGADRTDGGMDRYQICGCDMVDQWVHVQNEDLDEKSQKYLWRKVKAAEKVEEAATAAHDKAEKLGSGPTYEAAYDAMVEARIKLQDAVDAYFQACDDEGV